jgi:hypothetical protein
MTVSRRDGYVANSMQKVVCVMDANTPITVAAPKYSGPGGQAETGSSPLITDPVRHAIHLLGALAGDLKDFQALETRGAERGNSVRLAKSCRLRRW